jgi:hypothetical protein
MILSILMSRRRDGHAACAERQVRHLVAGGRFIHELQARVVWWISFYW